MTQRMTVLFISLVSVLAWCGLAAVAQNGQKPLYANSYALLIGINDYPNLPREKWLTYAINDVTELKSVLVKQYGFAESRVTVLANGQATKAGITKALASLCDSRRIGPDDRLLVYFSGHGQTVKSRNAGEMGFLLPADAAVDLNNPNNVAPYLDSCLSMETIWQYLDPSPAKHVLLLVDACFSGYLAHARGTDRSVSELTLKDWIAHPARQVITAGRKGEMTYEKPKWGHGAFTYKLLENLRANAAAPATLFTAHDLYAELQWSVTRLTDGRQTPQMGDRETEGEFLFIPNGATTAPATTSAASAGSTKGLGTTGRLLVTTTPAEAKVLLGDEEETTPCAFDIDLADAASREVSVEIRRRGYRTVIRTVTVTRDEPATLEVALAADDTAPILPSTAPAATTRKTVVAEGVGAGDDTALRRDQAISDAQRRAVEQVMGLYISSNTQVRNGELLEDAIYRNVQGFVETYEVLSESERDGLHRVRIQAQVRAGKIEEVAGALQTPARLIVTVKQTPAGDDDTLVQTTLAEQLLGRGFTLVDEATLTQARERTALKLLRDGRLEAAEALALQEKAEILISGKAQGKTKAFTLGETETITGEATLELRAVRADTGQVIAAGRVTASKAGFDRDAALQEALQAAVAAWMAKFAPLLARAVADPCREYQMSVSGATPAEITTLVHRLSESRFIRQAHLQGFTNGLAQVSIQYQGMAKTLFAELALMNGTGLKVDGMTGSTIRAHMK